MRTETVLKMEAIDLLIKEFGVLDTERFIKNIIMRKRPHAERRG
jgi:hypothetical protein